MSVCEGVYIVHVCAHACVHRVHVTWAVGLCAPGWNPCPQAGGGWEWWCRGGGGRGVLQGRGGKAGAEVARVTGRLGDMREGQVPAGPGVVVTSP